MDQSEKKAHPRDPSGHFQHPREDTAWEGYGVIRKALRYIRGPGKGPSGSFWGLEDKENRRQSIFQ